MKRLGVTGIIRSNGNHALCLLMGRRGKDPNRGLFVLPGGGVQDGESLEQAFCREVMEETGLEIQPEEKRWQYPYVVELADRIILVCSAMVKCKADYDDTPKDGSDLYEVGWHPVTNLPSDISPVVVPILERWGYHPKRK